MLSHAFAMWASYCLAIKAEDHDDAFHSPRSAKVHSHTLSPCKAERLPTLMGKCKNVASGMCLPGIQLTNGYLQHHFNDCKSPTRHSHAHIAHSRHA